VRISSLANVRAVKATDKTIESFMLSIDKEVFKAEVVILQVVAEAIFEFAVVELQVGICLILYRGETQVVGILLLTCSVIL
jgi:hypothetical protein